MTTRKNTAVATNTAPGSPSELGSVLLEVLRNLNREAQLARPLDPKAVAAIGNYRAIAADLFVLPENSINAGTTFGSALRA